MLQQYQKKILFKKHLIFLPQKLHFFSNFEAHLASVRTEQHHQSKALYTLIQKRWLFYEAILFGISWPSDRWVDRILGFVTRASLIETSHFVARHMHDTAWLITTDTTGCLPRAMTFENVHTTHTLRKMMTICFLFLPPLKDL